jgi:dTDP-4-dehydrorhamnose 3,5-epimerase
MSGLAITTGRLPGVQLIQPRAFADPRGFFTETHHAAKYAEAGLNRTFVQDNFSFSTRHVLRGLHSQRRQPQGKLVFVVQGEIFDVAVDIRVGSPTFGQWEGHLLSGNNHHQLFVPEGFAHGFVVLSDTASVMYKCTALYDGTDEQGVRWNDPDIAIDWPVASPVLSDKDRILPALAEIPPDLLPAYPGLTPAA